MRIGICGVRGLGLDFLRLFSLHPEVDAVYFADLNEEVRTIARSQAKVHKELVSFDELLAENIDCMAIFTPPWTHAELSVRALEACKHVISACPVGMSIEELHKVVDAVERTGQIYMTAETSYYYTGALFSRKAFQDGRFGDFVYSEGEYYYRPHAYRVWMRDYYGPMPSVLYPTHSITYTVTVSGRRIERVTCVGVPGLQEDVKSMKQREEWKGNETSNYTFLGTLTGGGVCRINEMRNVGCKGEFGSLIGTLGSFRQHSGCAFWTNGLLAERVGDLAEDINLTELWKDPAHHPQTEMAKRLPKSYEGEGMGHDGSHRFLADEFVRSVKENRRPHNHVWNGVKYVAPGIVAWESSKKDSEWLEVPDFGEPNDNRKPLEN